MRFDILAIHEVLEEDPGAGAICCPRILEREFEGLQTELVDES